MSDFLSNVGPLVLASIGNSTTWINFYFGGTNGNIPLVLMKISNLT